MKQSIAFFSVLFAFSTLLGKEIHRNSKPAFFIFITAVISCISCAAGLKTVREVPCSADSSLVLKMHQEFVELSYQDVYNLYYHNKTADKLLPVTGKTYILPKVKRYRDMIEVYDLTPGKGKFSIQYHYLFPSIFTEDEFKEICRCYEANKDSFKELGNKIGALVYGDYNLFLEVFKLPEGFYIKTVHNGDLAIVTDPSIEATTLPAEKKHFNNIGYFDDRGRLRLRKGKIISGEVTGFFGKPVKKVHFEAYKDKEEYTGEIETIWCDILYSEDKSGINSDFILSAVNYKGETLGQVFPYTP